MRLLRVDSSIRRQESVSRELTDTVERAWRAADPTAEVTHRDLAVTTGLSEAWQQAALTGYLPEDQHTPAMREARALANRLAEEALAAEAITIGAPLYNFGLPARLKSWIDLLIIDPRFDPRFTPIGHALAGIPLSLVIARGGGYGPGTPREGWEHATPYLQHIFADLFGAEVTLITAELTAVEYNPEMAPLRPLANRSRARAHARATATAAAHSHRAGLRDHRRVHPSLAAPR